MGRELRIETRLVAVRQAWGVMEANAGHVHVARQRFEAGMAACDTHVSLLTAWARLEVSALTVVHKPTALPPVSALWQAYGNCLACTTLAETSLRCASRCSSGPALVRKLAVVTARMVRVQLDIFQHATGQQVPVGSTSMHCYVQRAVSSRAEVGQA